MKHPEIIAVKIPEKTKIAVVSSKLILISYKCEEGIIWTHPLFTPMHDNWGEQRKLSYIGTFQEIVQKTDEEHMIRDNQVEDIFQQLIGAINVFKKDLVLSDDELKYFLLFKKNAT